MARHQKTAALIRIIHAPAMEIPGLAPQEPVPLYLSDGFDCIIRHMSLLIQVAVDATTIFGVAEWQWSDGYRTHDRKFSTSHRLAEPALVRGIWLSASAVDNGVHEQFLHQSGCRTGLSAAEDKSEFGNDAIVRGECRATGRSLIMQPQSPVDGLRAEPVVVQWTADPEQEKLINEVFSELI